MTSYVLSKCSGDSGAAITRQTAYPNKNLHSVSSIVHPPSRPLIQQYTILRYKQATIHLTRAILVVRAESWERTHFPIVPPEGHTTK